LLEWAPAAVHQLREDRAHLAGADPLVEDDADDRAAPARR
jgi:hypothetical protein